MAHDQKVKLTFNMSDGTTKDVAFIVPGGKDGRNAGLPAILGTEIDSATSMADVQAAISSRAHNPATRVEHIQWNHVTYPNYPGMTGRVRFTVIPAESGKYLYTGGDLEYPGQGVASMVWTNDDGQTINTMFDTKSKVLTRKTDSGSFSFNYPDTKTAKNACGKMGLGVYWKTTVPLHSVGNGDTNVIPQFWTTKIPCMADGTLVPYKFVVDYVEAASNATPSVAVWLICDGVPTHTMDITTGTTTQLQHAGSALTNGLNNTYPFAPPGDLAHEPTWSCAYFSYASKA